MSMRRWGAAVLAAALLTVAAARAAPQPEPPPAPDDPWRVTVAGESRIVLYFFWSERCPHCLRARPFVHGLAERHGWLEVRDLPVSQPANLQRYTELAAALGLPARSVPAFLFCGEMITGFDGPEGMGAHLEARLLACRSRPAGGRAGTRAPSTLPLPVLGELDPVAWSLPALAVTLGALDSFNPCAFFVLLFLLSLLVHAGSRARMLLVGGVFVLVSGAVYLLFMAAWLNLFMLIGQLPWMTLAAGLAAIAIGATNVKDALGPGHGVSLSIPASARPGLFARMRRLVSAERPGAVLTGTLALAVVANAYELLCTAGFPMVFTRVLTLHELSTAAYYGYLALYAAVYVLPLLLIVAAFVATLGRRKLSEREGRLLKLLSGVMMLGLGTMLVIAPAWLGNVAVAAGLLALALLVTLAAARRLPREPAVSPGEGSGG